ncbi:MAG: hypothetical protein JSR33_11565 [Proteobacteria bacterium]|nr:hypothetical protein [Pseudomonadota bacterium]
MKKFISQKISSSPSTIEKSKFDSTINKDSKTSGIEFMPNLQNKLVDACLLGDSDMVTELLRKGAKPNIKDSRELHPLAAAVFGMSITAVQTLLQETKGTPLMTWKQCEEHNKKHFENQVFVAQEFNPIDLSKPTLGFTWYHYLVDWKWNKVVAPRQSGQNLRK